MNIKLKTPPSPTDILAMLPVAKMRANLRISHVNENEIIEDCIKEAYDWLAGEHGWLNRTAINSTWTLTLPAFSNRIEIPKPPLKGVTSIKYLVDGVQETLPTSVYNVNPRGRRGCGIISLAANQRWPAAIDRVPEAVEIEFTAGYGTGAEVLAKHPALVKGMKLLASDYFRNREDTFIDVRMVEINRKVVNGVNRVAGRYRLMNNHA